MRELQLFHIEADSIHATADSMAEPHHYRIFLTEQKPTEKSAYLYPYTQPVERHLTPDWILYTVLGILIVIAWIRVIYDKFINHILESSFNYQRSLQLYSDPGVVRKRILFLFNILYLISTGLYSYLLMSYYSWFPMGIKGFRLFLAVTGFIAGLMIIRYIALKLTGYIFKCKELFDEYLFQLFLFSKLTGLVLVPFIFAIAYSRGITETVIVYASYAAIALVFILRIARSLRFIFKNAVLLFYLILYLCTLEILPVLVIVKLILSLA